MSNFTTNAEDLREAERLQARLRKSDDDDDEEHNVATSRRVPNVEIAEGAHKYVLITALLPGTNERQHFVVSRKHAAYHRNAAEPFVVKLERSGYKGISILGGGRIALDTAERSINIYGYSYGFGLADHALSKSVIESDPKWNGFQIDWSNEGY
jgi:phosphohistidine phosphatase